MRDVFLGSEAVREGQLTAYQLRSRFQSIYPDVYLPQCSTPSLRQRSEAAWLWSGRRGVVAGLAAAALHGSDWVDDDIPVELAWSNAHPPVGIITRNQSIRADEVTCVARLPVTTLARTAFDLGRLLPRGESIPRLDALMRAHRFAIEDVRVVIDAHPGARGVRRLRAALPLIDGGAASPKESWLRLLLIDAKLPVPTTQIPVHKRRQLVALLDMGWETYKVAVEYDGDQHRTNRKQYAKDHWRTRKLEAMGWIIIRVIAEDRPDDTVGRVRAALRARGWRDT